MRSDLAKRNLPEILPERSGNYGNCRIRLAGIIEDAVSIEVLEIKKNSVKLRCRIGDDPSQEMTLERGHVFLAHFTVKSESLGI